MKKATSWKKKSWFFWMGLSHLHQGQFIRCDWSELRPNKTVFRFMHSLAGKWTVHLAAVNVLILTLNHRSNRSILCTDPPYEACIYIFLCSSPFGRQLVFVDMTWRCLELCISAKPCTLWQPPFWRAANLTHPLPMYCADARTDILPLSESRAWMLA